MRTLLLLSVVSLLAVLPAPAAADLIIVDGSGGGDYLTIQEGVDAAAWSGDTVLVYPGTYADIHNCGGYCEPVNVCIEKSITLVSLNGPEVTVIDGGDGAQLGIMVGYGDPVVIEGFTVISGWRGGRSDAAITAYSGEVCGNVCLGYGTGITTDSWWYAGRGSERSEARDTAIVIADNTVEANETGIFVRSWSGSHALVSGNSVHGGQFAGVSVYGLGSVSLVGNEISGSTRGVRIQNPSWNAGSLLSVDLQSNRIVDNVETNIEIYLAEVSTGSDCHVTIGGAPEHANDIYGAPINLKAAAYNVDLLLDATYNYWGSIACTTFVPLFDIHENIPDSAFIFEPFLDETHTIAYDCQGVPVEQLSWGRIKSLFR